VPLAALALALAFMRALLRCTPGSFTVAYSCIHVMCVHLRIYVERERAREREREMYVGGWVCRCVCQGPCVYIHAHTHTHTHIHTHTVGRGGADLDRRHTAVRGLGRNAGFGRGQVKKIKKIN
jgi:hypothetical protein